MTPFKVFPPIAKSVEKLGEVGQVLLEAPVPSPPHRHTLRGKIKVEKKGEIEMSYEGDSSLSKIDQVFLFAFGLLVICAIAWWIVTGHNPLTFH